MIATRKRHKRLGKPTDDVAVAKAVLLYAISRMGEFLPEDELIHLVVDQSRLDYFTMRQYLLELEQEGLITVRKEREYRMYSVRGNGWVVLNQFKQSIPMSIRDSIDGYISSHQEEIRREKSIRARYTQESSNEFTVHMNIEENGQTLLYIQLNAGDREQAQLICDQFTREAAQLYAGLVGQLTREIK